MRFVRAAVRAVGGMDGHAGPQAKMVPPLLDMAGRRRSARMRMQAVTAELLSAPGRFVWRSDVGDHCAGCGRWSERPMMADWGTHTTAYCFPDCWLDAVADEERQREALSERRAAMARAAVWL